MGLTTIDPHSQKGHTEIYKIPKFGVTYTKLGVTNTKLDRDTAIYIRPN